MTYLMDATGNVSGEDLTINNELYGDVSKKPVLRTRGLSIVFRGRQRK